MMEIERLQHIADTLAAHTAEMADINHRNLRILHTTGRVIERASQIDNSMLGEIRDTTRGWGKGSLKAVITLGAAALSIAAGYQAGNNQSTRINTIDP